jgi:hypothetical protein
MREGNVDQPASWIERGWTDRDGQRWITTADGPRQSGTPFLWPAGRRARPALWTMCVTWVTEWRAGGHAARKESR